MWFWPLLTYVLDLGSQLVIAIHVLAECIASVAIPQFLTTSECKIMAMEGDSHSFW